MATKTKAKKAAPRKAPARKKAAPKNEAAAAPKAPEERVVDDKHPGRFINDTRGPSAPVLGHFVDVVSGPCKGRYGVFQTVEGNDAVVRTRDNESEQLNVKVSDLRRAEAGRR